MRTITCYEVYVTYEDDDWFEPNCEEPVSYYESEENAIKKRNELYFEDKMNILPVLCKDCDYVNDDKYEIHHCYITTSYRYRKLTIQLED